LRLEIEIEIEIATSCIGIAAATFSKPKQE